MQRLIYRIHEDFLKEINKRKRLYSKSMIFSPIVLFITNIMIILSLGNSLIDSVLELTILSIITTAYSVGLPLQAIKRLHRIIIQYSFEDGRVQISTLHYQADFNIDSVVLKMDYVKLFDGKIYEVFYFSDDSRELFFIKRYIDLSHFDLPTQ
jgi:hypothetical protein